MLQYLPWHLFIAVRLLLETVIATKGKVAALLLSQSIQAIWNVLVHQALLPVGHVNTFW